MNMHIFGNRSSPAIATFGLRYAARLPSLYPFIESRSFMVNNLFVNEGMGSADSAEEAVEFLTNACRILGDCNIHLHKIISSNLEVLAFFPSSEISPDIRFLDLFASSSQSALDLTWKSQRHSNIRELTANLREERS